MSGFLIQVRKLVLVLLCAVRRGVWNPRVAVAIVVDLWRHFDELLGPAEFLVSIVCLMYYLFSIYSVLIEQLSRNRFIQIHFTTFLHLFWTFGPFQFLGWIPYLWRY